MAFKQMHYEFLDTQKLGNSLAVHACKVIQLSVTNELGLENY